MSKAIADTATPANSLFSPEGVHLEFPVVGPGPRMLAYLIDFLIIIFLILIMAFVLFALLPISSWLTPLFDRLVQDDSTKVDPAEAQKMLGQAAGILIALFVLLQFIVDTGYFIFWEMVTNGRSIGKAVMHLRVICRDGSPITLRASAIRNLMRIADLLPANYLAGLISMVVSANGERLGDHAAGTMVIRLDRTEPTLELIAGDEIPAISLNRGQLAHIGPAELQLIRGVLRRLPNLPGSRAQLLAGQAAETIQARMELAELPTTDSIQFLRQVLILAERHAHLPP